MATAVLQNAVIPVSEDPDVIAARASLDGDNPSPAARVAGFVKLGSLFARPARIVVKEATAFGGTQSSLAIRVVDHDGIALPGRHELMLRTSDDRYDPDTPMAAPFVYFVGPTLAATPGAELIALHDSGIPNLGRWALIRTDPSGQAHIRVILVGGVPPRTFFTRVEQPLAGIADLAGGALVMDPATHQTDLVPF
jgi:hypothetical protein